MGRRGLRYQDVCPADRLLKADCRIIKALDLSCSTQIWLLLAAKWWGLSMWPLPVRRSCPSTMRPKAHFARNGLDHRRPESIPDLQKCVRFWFGVAGAVLGRALLTDSPKVFVALSGASASTKWDY
jgi:hypothetical protein